MSGADRDGHLRRAAFRIARMDRFPIPPAERLTEMDRAAARLALHGFDQAIRTALRSPE